MRVQLDQAHAHVDQVGAHLYLAHRLHQGVEQTMHGRMEVRQLLQMGVAMDIPVPSVLEGRHLPEVAGIDDVEGAVGV